MADERRRKKRDEGFLASVAGIPWGDGRQDLADDEVGLLDAPLEPKLAALTYKSRRLTRRCI